MQHVVQESPPSFLQHVYQQVCIERKPLRYVINYSSLFFLSIMSLLGPADPLLPSDSLECQIPLPSMSQILIIVLLFLCHLFPNFLRVILFMTNMNIFFC